MDQTLKPQTSANEQPQAASVGGGTTLRSNDALLNTLSSTKRSSIPTTQSDDAVDFFMLKGQRYRNVRCLSNNSGEAQVFLVERGDREFVLKVYYPSFVFKKNLLKIVKSMQMEMINLE